MRYTLRSDDDESKFHTLSGMTYPFDGLTIIIHNGNQDWSKNPPRSEEEDRIRVYLEDMQKANPNDMISEIAMKASKEYKEDPKIMSKTEEWIKYNFAEYFEEQAKDYENKIQKIEEKTKIEDENAKLIEENARIKEQIAKVKEETRRLEKEIAKNLIAASSYSLSEIAKITGLEEYELKNLSS